MLFFIRMISLQDLLIMDLLPSTFFSLPAFAIELAVCFILLRHYKLIYLQLILLPINFFIAYRLYSSAYELYRHPGTNLSDIHSSPDDVIVSLTVGVYVFILLTTSPYLARLIRALLKLPIKQ